MTLVDERSRCACPSSRCSTGDGVRRVRGRAGGRGGDRGRAGRHLGRHQHRRRRGRGGHPGRHRPHPLPRRHHRARSPGEKAGIIKPGAVAVLGQQQVAAAEVLLRRAAEVGAHRRQGRAGVRRHRPRTGRRRPVARPARAGWCSYHDLLLPLFGEHQAGNAACALAAVEAFAGPARRLARWTSELVRTAFAGMTSPGRLEVLRRSPVVIADAAHNPAGHGGQPGRGDRGVHLPAPDRGAGGQCRQGCARHPRPSWNRSRTSWW